MMDTPLTKEYAEFLVKAAGYTNWYIDFCVDDTRYEKAGQIMEQEKVERGLVEKHLRKRDKQHKYAEMITHEAKFIHCSGPDCGKWFCTDPWLPYGYSQVNNRIIWVGARKAYFCVAKCYPAL